MARVFLLEGNERGRGREERMEGCSSLGVTKERS